MQTYPDILAIRVDAGLCFANTNYWEDAILSHLARQNTVKHLIVSGAAINFIDVSALEALDALYLQLRGAGVQLHLADIKGPVLDQLQKSGFLEALGTEHVHFCTHDAMQAVGCVV